ncbi:hypothetical protein C1J05_11470 [Sulfitobacter sp. JL08]|nr:hypothetical protein C1J05_11470 [Sulfitobacter sp. JL08]
MAAILTVAFAAPTTAQVATDCPNPDLYSGDYFLTCNEFQGSVKETTQAENVTYLEGTDTITGLDNSQPGFTISNSYFLYDLTEFGGSLIDENLNIEVTFFATGMLDSSTGGPSAYEDLAFYDVTQASIDFLLGASSTTTLTQVFSDLETMGAGGSSFGTKRINDSDLQGEAIPTFSIVLSDAALTDLNLAIGNPELDYWGLGAHLTSTNGRSVQISSLSITDAPTSGLRAVPEVSATGALAAFGSLLAMMAFLWERRRVTAAAV